MSFKILIHGLLLAATGCLIGCQPTGEELLKKGEIDAHRRIRVNEEMEIAVWVIKHRKETDRPPATVVVLHPWLTDKNYMFGFGKSLANDGWDVVLPDLRNHGRSTWGRAGWGALEKVDIKRVMDALLEEKLVSDRIYAMGISLGGCVAILYGESDPRCRGVLAVAPVDGLLGIVEQLPFRQEPVDEKVTQMAAEVNIEPDDAIPSVAAKTAKIPLVLVTGWFDVIVPSNQTDRIYDNWAGPKKKHGLPGGHGSIQVGTGWLFQWWMNDLRDMAEPKDKAKDA